MQEEIGNKVEGEAGSPPSVFGGALSVKGGNLTKKTGSASNADHPNSEMQEKKIKKRL